MAKYKYDYTTGTQVRDTSPDLDKELYLKAIEMSKRAPITNNPNEYLADDGCLYPSEESAKKASQCYYEDKKPRSR